MNMLLRIWNKRGMFTIEAVVLLYDLITTILILFMWSRLNSPLTMLMEHIGIAVLTVALAVVYDKLPSKWTNFLRIAVQLALLSYWYPETFEFNRSFDNLDHIFAAAEQSIFGCQPSILFPAALPTSLESEAFYMGYFSYYPMIFAVVLCYFFLRNKIFEKASFILIASFYIYYLIYIVLPVAGPQFYFPAIGWDQAAAGVFPSIGDYFNTHVAVIHGPGDATGFFYDLVQGAHDAGERPTAAFPSSHVGVSTIIMILFWKLSKRITAIVTPFYVLLCLSTVYIQAHYLIDSIAGLLTAGLIYYLSSLLFKAVNRADFPKN